MTSPLLRFAALTVVATTVTTGIINRRDVPDPPRAKVLSPLALTADSAAAPGGFDTVQSVEGAEMVGLTYTVPEGGAEPKVEVRGQRDGQWTEWLDLSAESDDGPDADSPEFHPGQRSTSPAWLGHDEQQVEVRVTSGAIADLKLHPIDSEPPKANGGALSIPAADAFVPTPGIYGRAQWGADEADAFTQPGCESGPTYAAGGITRAHVHHTVNSNSYGPSDSPAHLRGIQAYHMVANGWCDIGYNFLVDRYGQMFEGRRGGIGRAVVGAHASGFNTNSTGIALIGDFTSSGVPDAAYNALVYLLAWKLSYHGVPADGQVWVRVGANEGAYWPEGTIISLDRITGHRDVNATGCPGQFLYDLLPRLRADVAYVLATQPQEQRLMCDWDGNGTDTPGVVFNGVWVIRNSNSDGPPDASFLYGNPGDIALCGDWYHNGHDSPAIYRGGFLYMRSSLMPNVDVTSVAWFGNPGDRPVVGDWNGDGFDTIGVVRSGVWYLTNNYLPLGTIVLRFGNPGDTPLTGDWTHKGFDTPGIWRPGQFVLSDTLSTSFGDHAVNLGNPTDKPVVGDFDGNGTTTPGLLRGFYWYLLSSIGPDATLSSFVF
jgi:hypothetical protein